MATLADIAAQLKEPFSFDDIDFLPKGKIERDGKTLCMALPYADPRAYQDRLNQLAPGEWSTPAPLALTVGDKLICYVTVIVYGIAHTDVGEAMPGENQGTEAWAQAFKRACSQFGLGRYLYDLEKEWVPFNPQKKQIDLDKAQKAAIVRKMYQKAGIAIPGTVRVVDATPTSNGTAKKTRKEIIDAYNAGKQSGVWKSISEFYAAASALMGMPINEQNVNMLSDQALVELLAQDAA
jgi:hypothetical protein